jgi:hypothetical protein
MCACLGHAIKERAPSQRRGDKASGRACLEHVLLVQVASQE